MQKTTGILLAILSSILLVLSFPSAFNKNGFFILAWFGLLPLFYALENKGYKERFLIGYLAGLVFYTGILYWLFQVTVPGAIVLILVLSLSFGIFGFFLRNAIRNTQYAILYIPSLWVSIEFLRTYLFTGFPWALLGYSQHLNLPVIQIADATGAYGVSFLIVCINCVLCKAFVKRTKNRMTLFVGAALLLGAVLFYGKYNLERPIHEGDLKVAAIQGNIPQHIKWDTDFENYISDKYESISRDAAETKSDLIIWPETAVPGSLESEAHLLKRMSSLARSTNRTFLVGTMKEARQGFYNAATLVSKKGRIVKSYGKLHLVPFGEYVPFERYIPFRRLIDKPIGDFVPGEEYTLFRFSVAKYVSAPGKDSKSIEKETLFYNFGALICFEDIFPGLVRNFVRKGARFMVVMTNDAWFGRSPAAFQHNQASVFRAVENRVPFVRAANTGVTCIIDQKGKIVGSVDVQGEELFVDGFVTGLIRPFHWESIYMKFGDCFAWTCVLIVLFGLIWLKLRRTI